MSEQTEDCSNGKGKRSAIGERAAGRTRETRRPPASQRAVKPAPTNSTLNADDRTRRERTREGERRRDSDGGEEDSNRSVNQPHENERPNDRREREREWRENTEREGGE